MKKYILLFGLAFVLFGCVNEKNGNISNYLSWDANGTLDLINIPICFANAGDPAPTQISISMSGSAVDDSNCMADLQAYGENGNLTFPGDSESFITYRNEANSDIVKFQSIASCSGLSLKSTAVFYVNGLRYFGTSSITFS